MKPRPEKFSITIGGYFGPAFWIEKWEDRLRYTATQAGQINKQVDWLTPTIEQWQLVAAALNEIGVWEWLPHYQNPGVCDGVQWSIEIVWDTKRIRSQGDNHYPGAHGIPSGSSKQTKEFKELLQAVRQLIGDRLFG